MGFYTCVYIYLGRLLSQDGYSKIKDILPKEWITNCADERGRYILHPPNCCIQIGSVDGILEKREIAEGEVAWSEVVRAKLETKLEPLKEVTHEYIDQLKKYIKDAGDPEMNCNIYILELDWDTYDVHVCRVKNNIKVNLLK